MGRWDNLITERGVNLPGMRGFVKFPDDKAARPIVTADSITIVVDLPPRVLSPNGRSHWATKAAAVKKARKQAGEEAGWRMRAAGIAPPLWEIATVHAIFYKRVRRQADEDNLIASLKPYLDGLADARVVGNDRNFKRPTVQQEIDRDRPRLEIIVTRAATIGSATA
jgi:crossover junction endodeoxyribonuclease RusA